VALFNPNQFNVQLSGAGAIASLSINLKGADPTGGNIYNVYPGEIFFPQAPRNSQYVSYPFTVSPDSVGISAADVTASFSQQAPAPSIKHQYYQMRLNIAPGKLVNGAALFFGIARYQ